MAVFHRLNLLRVFPAHGGQIIREDQSAFQEIHLAEKFHRFHAEKAFRQTKIRERVARKKSVITHIVNRENYRHGAKQWIRFVKRSQQHRHERRLPVMAMDHVRGPDVLADFDGRAAELTKAVGVVGIILALQAVKLVAVKIFGIVHEKIAHAADDGAIGNRGKAEAAAERNRHAGHDHRRGFCSAVARQHDGDFMAQLNERLRKSFDNVRQAARL